MSALNEYIFENKYSMSVMAETSHVPMAGEHAPTADAAMQVATAVLRAALVVYTGRGGGGGGGGGRFTHTEPALPLNAVVRSAVFDIQTAEHSTRLNEVAPENIVEKSVTFTTFHAERS
jgi:hypothetical protein